MHMVITVFLYFIKKLVMTGSEGVTIFTFDSRLTFFLLLVKMTTYCQIGEYSYENSIVF